nr:hypothetical protein [Tanacetum cinerariifolium]
VDSKYSLRLSTSRFLHNRFGFIQGDYIFYKSRSRSKYWNQQVEPKINDIDADVKKDVEEVVELMEIAKIIVEEVSTGGGELNASNEKPSTTRIASLKSLSKDKGKANLVEEPKILKSRKDQIVLDEEVARGIEAEWNAGIKGNIDWNV